jgi:thiamine-monophosphate kinase
MLSEFDLIKQYFVRPATGKATLGIGDDCALLTPSPGMQTAISSDMLVEGRHFFAGEDPRRLGHKSLAVNLSDLAAMGARPVAFTLALALPAADRAWLSGFSAGLFALADAHGCELIGGDTTKGPLNICITVFGEVAPGRALRRDAAQAGDDIWVSGTLGDARLALAGHLGEVALAADALAAAGTRLHMPTPRVALGLALQGIAHAAIDLSDGLPVLASREPALRRTFSAAGGDDYEICFTAPTNARDAVLAAGAASNTPVTRIGRIESTPGLRFTDAAGAPLDLRLSGFDHFSAGQ